ncbi:MAG: protein-glutamate O-methyltransferase CheR [Polyangiaceae bacterium]|nr:protein-glutamate O-methyltransferase CheR [Polyangiaceae bacterium]
MSLSPTEADFVRKLVYDRSAIVLDESKEYLIKSRLESLALETGHESIDALLGETRRGTVGLESKVVEALTTNETSFFRDVAPFECLKKNLLPKVLEKRQTSRSLTIWCAACSTGQEPYSISMLLHEHFPNLTDWNVRIFGTDISDQVLERARSGRYRQLEVNRGLPATMLIKYFTRSGTQWEVVEHVRKRVEFSNLNLIGEWKLSRRPDIVFLRNVLIYFDVPTKRKILERVAREMNGDGGLFLGASETTLNVDPQWTRVGCDKAGYYQVGPETR